MTTTLKPFSPILVPTDKIGELFLSQEGHLKYCNINDEIYPLPIRVYHPQILLLIDQEAEIKDNDHYLYGSHIFKCSIKGEAEDCKRLGCKKIIATSSHDQYPSLPSINPSDIQWMVEEYNKEGKLSDFVEVEVKLICNNVNNNECCGNNGCGNGEFIIKTNPADGSIRIVKPTVEKGDKYIFEKMAKIEAEENFKLYCKKNKMYSRDEVIELLKKYGRDMAAKLLGDDVNIVPEQWMK